MDELINKCKKIFENKNELKDENIEQLLMDFFGFQVSDVYKYILTYYGEVELKEDFEVFGNYHSTLADDNGVEPFMYFFSLSGKNNITLYYNRYKEQIPKGMYPIGLADGGNLICINNKEQVYLWVHDSIEKPSKIFDSISQMIMMIKKIEIKEEPLRVNKKKSKLSDDFWADL